MAVESPIWWLSFADASLPKGEQFLGAVIIDGVADMITAIRAAHAAGINPGGDVVAQMLPEHASQIVRDDETFKLLDKPTALALDGEFAKRMTRLGL